MSLFGDCHPTYAAWQAIKGMYFFYHLANVGKKLVADLMSVVPIAHDDGDDDDDSDDDDDAPTPMPIWAFMSISYGWIAHADIHTESLRYFLLFP